MYAVIKTGGKQYRVTTGDKIKVEHLSSDVGDVVTIDQVLAVTNGEASLIGEPVVEGALVSATVIEQGRHKKVRVFKMRRRKHYRKTQGHRQSYTEIFVNRIDSSLGADSADAKDALENASARRERVAAMTLGGAAAAQATDEARAAYAARSSQSGDTGEDRNHSESDLVAADPSAAPEKAASESVAASASISSDDLTKVEGIGPKIGELLHADGIRTFADLAAVDSDRIQKVLEAGGAQFASHDPSTWPQQAKLAAEGKWDELKKWQDELDGGRV